MKILGVSLFLTLLAFNQSSHTQEPVKQRGAFVNGTRIILSPPANFNPSTQFPGYQLESHNSSIMVTEIPGAFAAAAAGFSSPSELSKREMSVLNKQEVKVDGQNGLLLKVEQTAYGTKFLKWLLIFGDEKETVMITATFPKRHEVELSEKLRESILTSEWDRNKDVPLAEGLNFTVTEKGELRLSKRVSNMLVFTRNGIFPSKDVRDPLFIVGQSFSKTAIPDNEEYARARVLQISQVEDIRIEQSTKINIEKLNGYEIVASGKDTKSSQPMLIYQVMLFEEPNYFLMQGLVSNENRQASIAVFKEMAKTFKRR